MKNLIEPAFNSAVGRHCTPAAWKSCIVCLISAIALALAGTGCVTTQFPSAEVKPVASYRYLQRTNGLAIAIEPSTSSVEVKRLFGDDLLNVRLPNVLPVLVVATNESSSSSFVISSKHFTLVNGTRQSAGGEVQNVKRPSDVAGTTLTAGLMAGPLGALVGYAVSSTGYESYSHKQKDADPINENLRHRELRLKTLSPGSGTHGYVYFPITKKQDRLEYWAVVFKVERSGVEEEKTVVFPFEWQAQ